MCRQPGDSVPVNQHPPPRQPGLLLAVDTSDLTAALHKPKSFAIVSADAAPAFLAGAAGNFLGIEIRHE